MDVTYKYTGTSNPLYGPTYTVPDIWVDWLKQWWDTVLLANGYVTQGAPWVPQYESGVVAWPGNNGTMQTAELNPLQFPTQDTALHLAQRYAVDGKALHVIEVPFLGLGPIHSTAMQRLLQWPNLATLPAYQLANYFTNNPEDKSDAADALCRLYIAKVWPGK